MSTVPSATPVQLFSGPAGAGHLGDALAHMAVPAVLVDADGVVTGVNASAGQCFNLGEACGRALKEVLSGWTGVHALLPYLSNPGCDVLLASEPERIALGPRVMECAVRPLAAASWGAGAILTFVDVSAQARAVEDAQRDPLTGLLNRSALHAQLVATLARGSGGALLCIDLDRFKAVNDTLGHPTGDALLLKIASRLRRATRVGDAVARLGGDEFAVLQLPDGPGMGPGLSVPGPRPEQVLAARLVDLLGRTYVVNGHMLNVGASVGVAQLGGDGTDADTLLRNADLALYQAKADGRGTFRCFEPAMDERLQARRLLELDLRRALAFKEFELAYQPQVRATDREIVGFEALIRWRNPVRGLVSPAAFIPLAEEIGLMASIGEWVLHTACKEAASWPRPVSVAVNLSPVQFRNPRLADSVLGALLQSGLPPHRLELEITEGALLENTEAVVATLSRLSALGVRTSMDDFGTGYSSLSYLQKFRFSKIKIDQSFVRQVDANPESTAIVRAVAALGASLGMKTTAEGVETPEQLARIRAEGCTEIQGYLTGRPMAGADAARLLAAPPSPLPEQEDPAPQPFTGD